MPSLATSKVVLGFVTVVVAVIVESSDATYTAAACKAKDISDIYAAIRYDTHLPPVPPQLPMRPMRAPEEPEGRGVGNGSLEFPPRVYAACLNYHRTSLTMNEEVKGTVQAPIRKHIYVRTAHTRVQRPPKDDKNSPSFLQHSLSDSIIALPYRYLRLRLYTTLMPFKFHSSSS
jgi:hypothetical protein